MLENGQTWKEMLRDVLAFEAAKWGQLRFEEWASVVQPFVEYRTSYQVVGIVCMVDVLDLEDDSVVVSISVSRAAESMNPIYLLNFFFARGFHKESSVFTFRRLDSDQRSLTAEVIMRGST